MKKGINSLVWLIAIAGFLVGLYGLYQRFTFEHRLTDYGSYIPWGLWVAAYIYFIGLSAGSFLLSTLVYVFQVKQLKKIGKLALFTAFGCLVAALLSIWMDLGHMGRVYRVVLYGNLKSMMTWMGILYSSYFLVILIELWFALRPDLVRKAQEGSGLCSLLSLGSRDTSEASLARDAKVLKVLGIIGVPLAIAFHGGVGALFGVVGARTYWHSGLTPIAFLIGALASGGCLLTAIVYVWGPGRDKEQFNETMGYLAKVVVPLVLFDFLLEIAEYFVGMYPGIPDEADPIKAVLFGQYWYVFWIVHVLLGVIIPSWMMFRGSLATKYGRGTGAIALGALMVAVTFMAVRLNIVIPAQISPEIAGLEYAFTGPGLEYHYMPTLMEWLVTIWVSSFGALLFLIGYKLLPIVNEEEREVA